MSTKTIGTESTSVRTRVDAPPMPWLTSPSTLADRLVHIQAMGERIQALIAFMVQIGALSGSSTEAKERAVTAFHEKMILLEGQLVRIQEELRLG